MAHCRVTADSQLDLPLHLAWISKYRKKRLRGEVGVKLRPIDRTIRGKLEVEILKDHVNSDHVHLSMSSPTPVSASYLMLRVKGKISQLLMLEYSQLKRQCWVGSSAPGGSSLRVRPT